MMGAMTPTTQYREVDSANFMYYNSIGIDNPVKCMWLKKNNLETLYGKQQKATIRYLEIWAKKWKTYDSSTNVSFAMTDDPVVPTPPLIVGGSKLTQTKNTQRQSFRNLARSRFI